MVMKTKNMKNKLAQMKIQQMSFMIVAVFLFLAMVGMMVLTVRMSELKNSATVLEEQNAKLLVTKLASSPEFACGYVYGNEKTDCVDADKVMVLKDNINQYVNFWGATNIEVRKIYPPSTRTVECTKENYPTCNYIKVINKSSSNLGFDLSNYVALCRKTNISDKFVNKCEIAKLIVRYEAKS